MIFFKCYSLIIYNDFHVYSLGSFTLNNIFLFKNLGIYLTLSINFGHRNINIGNVLKVLNYINCNTKIFNSVTASV